MLGKSVIVFDPILVDDENERPATVPHLGVITRLHDDGSADVSVFCNARDWLHAGRGPVQIIERAHLADVGCQSRPGRSWFTHPDMSIEDQQLCYRDMLHRFGIVPAKLQKANSPAAPTAAAVASGPTDKPVGKGDPAPKRRR